MERQVVDPVVAAAGLRDWEALKPLLHPYLHWTDRDGRTIRGRTNVMTRREHIAPARRPARFELRDGQVYRWVE